jgi:prevent-host-death family protein
MCTDQRLGGVPLDVGVRELRDQLRRWLDAVERGDELTITERGRPIARLISVSSPPILERLIAEGVVTPAKRPRRQNRAHRTVRARGTVSDLVAQQRR